MLFVFQHCEDKTEFEVQITNKNTFKGLPVQHRFNVPLEALEKLEASNVTQGNYVESLISTAGKKTGMKKKQRPSLKTIDKFTRKHLHKFPYNIEKNNSAKNWKMIQKDFPDLTDEEIIANMETIETYYSLNLDHIVFEDIANNPEETAETAQKTNYEICDYMNTRDCVQTKLLIDGNLDVVYLGKAAYAILEMEAEIDDEAVYKEYEMTSNDTRQDAYRHIIMNALLGQGITPPFLPKHPVWTLLKR